MQGRASKKGRNFKECHFDRKEIFSVPWKEPQVSLMQSQRTLRSEEAQTLNSEINCISHFALVMEYQ